MDIFGNCMEIFCPNNFRFLPNYAEFPMKHNLKYLPGNILDPVKINIFQHFMRYIFQHFISYKMV